MEVNVLKVFKELSAQKVNICRQKHFPSCFKLINVGITGKPICAEHGQQNLKPAGYGSLWPAA